MNALILCVGALKENWEREACREYLKRLSRFGKYEVEEVPDEPEPPKPSEALNRRLIECEGRALLARIKPRDTVISLCIDARQMSSPEFAGFTRALEGGGRCVFVIGGSLGLSESVTSLSENRVSFSKLTFPHRLMRVILLEQLYRAAQINAGARYHK